MKISQMIQREDFYGINEKTLKRYFEGTDETTLYIYPRLNAIVDKNPSKRVVNYLLCEYSVKSGILKRMTVRFYVKLCLFSKGILADKKICVAMQPNRDVLVYPCNKKYRIFDFQHGTVDVIAKYGFDDSDLQHEIAFRKRADLPEFVPGFVCCNENGYRETIIDGRPLVRITEGFEDLRDKAYNLLLGYGESYQKIMAARTYVKSLQTEILVLLQHKADNATPLAGIVQHLITWVTEDNDVTLTFSHGDLQAGNIWVENNTQKIYIIDWESYGIRSVWYDKATLFQGLRPGGLSAYFSAIVPKEERAIVLLEDIVFQLKQLNSLPENFGMKQFRKYCDTIAKWLKTGE